MVTCTGFSKTFNLASLHPAHIVITDEELLPVLRRSCWMDPSNFTTESVKAAVTDPTGWLEQVRDYLKGNIDTALRLISELLPKAKCRHPEGSYLLWIDFSGYGLSDEELQQRIFGEAKVALSVGSRLDPGRSECFRRMTVACPRAELIQALERIAEVLK